MIFLHKTVNFVTNSYIFVINDCFSHNLRFLIYYSFERSISAFAQLNELKKSTKELHVEKQTK